MNGAYVSERVVNISDCERHILSSFTLIEMLRAEVEKADPAIVVIDSLSKDLHKELLELKYFEFLVERRNTVGECL